MKSRIALLLSLIILVGCGDKKNQETASKTTSESKQGGFSVFIGTYGKTENDGIFKTYMDKSGNLSDPVLIQQAVNPSFLSLGYNKNYLYSVGEEGNGSVLSYKVVSPDSLVLINSVSSGGNGPCYVSIARDQKTVFAANYGDGVVMSASVKEGKLTSASEVQQEGPVGEYNRKGPHAHAIKQHPNNRRVYAPDLGADKVFIYKLENSKLVPNDVPFAALPEGSGPRHIDFSQTGKFAFVINELSSTIVSFRVEGNGALNPVDTVSTIPADFDGENYCADIHVHPTDRFVYGSNRGHDSIVGFKLNRDGTLELIGFAQEDIEWPRNFGIAPDGEHMIVASQNADRLTPYTVEGDGTLTKTGPSVKVPKPVCVVFH